MHKKSDVYEMVLDKIQAGISKIIAEAELLVDVAHGDVIEVPEEAGFNDGTFPFCANVIALADAAGSHGECRQAKVTRVYLMIDFDGKHSVNWVGHIMAPTGNWIVHDVLLARIEPPPHAAIKLIV